jgi:hypothetical protein
MNDLDKGRVESAAEELCSAWKYLLSNPSVIDFQDLSREPEDILCYGRINIDRECSLSLSNVDFV